MVVLGLILQDSLAFTFLLLLNTSIAGAPNLYSSLDFLPPDLHYSIPLWMSETWVIFLDFSDAKLVV